MPYSVYQGMFMEPDKKIQRLSELPTMPSTIGTMAWNETGDWRYLTPVIANKLAPCSGSCPLGIPIPSYLAALQHGDLQRGLTLLLSHNPLPGLTGRLCYHPCQAHCVRKKVDRAVSVQEIERFLACTGTEAKIEKKARNGKQIVIVGSGPLGLSCAFFLGCMGCQVVVMEPSKQAGGALLDLSPEDIEREIIEEDIKRLIVLADVVLETGTAVDFDAPGENLSKADLIILDPTGLSEDFPMPSKATAFDPLDGASVAGDLITPLLPKNLNPFKKRMIAHYLALGRLTADKAFNRLMTSSGERDLSQWKRDVPRQPVKVGHVKIERLVSCDVAPNPHADQEGAGEHERISQEAQRCLSCGTCNLCLQCVSFCPDASIRLNEQEAAVQVDLDHCKGCGICAYECLRGVITMEEIGS